jgi:hypothetical protein
MTDCRPGVKGSSHLLNVKAAPKKAAKKTAAKKASKKGAKK